MGADLGGELRGPLRDLYTSLTEGEKPKGDKKPEMKKDEPILKVKLVNGKKTRDSVCVDFIGGGHPLAYPKVIPEDEVWIEEELAPDEQLDILVHELCEYALMTKGIPYTTAHNLANKMELVYRGFEAKWKTLNAPMAKVGKKDKVLEAEAPPEPKPSIDPVKPKCPVCKGDKVGTYRHKGAPSICAKGHQWGATCGHEKCASSPIGPTPITESATATALPPKQDLSPSLCPKCGGRKTSLIPHVCPKAGKKWNGSGKRFITPTNEALVDEPDLLSYVEKKASNTHPNDHVPSQYRWARNKAFNPMTLEHMIPGGKKGWQLWLDGEHRAQPGRWDKLSKDETKVAEPVIVTPDHIWDGWHRIAAAIVKGLTSIPAIVGTHAG